MLDEGFGVQALELLLLDLLDGNEVSRRGHPRSTLGPVDQVVDVSEDSSDLVRDVGKRELATVTLGDFSRFAVGHVPDDL